MEILSLFNTSQRGGLEMNQKCESLPLVIELETCEEEERRASGFDSTKPQPNTHISANLMEMIEDYYYYYHRGSITHAGVGVPSHRLYLWNS